VNLPKVYAPFAVTIQIFTYPRRKPATLPHAMLQVNFGAVLRAAGSSLGYYSTVRDDL
jgi:hypothetical protein